MASIGVGFNSGGSASAPNGGGSPSLATALRDVADDLAAIKLAFNTLVTKLNADAGVTDTNYAAIGTLLTLKV
jgi:hypothetical protein